MKHRIKKAQEAKAHAAQMAKVCCLITVLTGGTAPKAVPKVTLAVKGSAG